MVKSVYNVIKEQEHLLTEDAKKYGVYDFDFGFGEGFNSIINGYLGFGTYLLMERHMPRLEDGLKNVQRAIAYTEYLSYSKKKHPEYRKSQKIVGDTMSDFHPHGDSSIYKAMTRMTDVNGSSKVPLLDGSGNMGRFESEDSAGAQRYTDARGNKNLEFLFHSIDGAEFIESSATERLEIVKGAPTRYPYALFGLAQDGTGIGVSTVTPIYDVVDVADAVQEYLRKGKITAILAPDFVGGSYVVRNTKEFKKLMVTGKANIKVRGKVEIKGKEVFLTNLPHGVKVERLTREINELELKGVKAYVGTSFGQIPSVRVMCPSKAEVQTVIEKIYLFTSFQKNINFSSRYLFGDSLISVGFYEAVKNWVSWRKDTLNRELQARLNKLREDYQKLAPFVDLLNDGDAHREFMSIFGNVDRSEDEARQFLVDFGTSNEGIKFIMERSMRALRNGGKYIEKANSLQESIQSLEEDLSNLSEIIYRDMEAMKFELKDYKRLSEITDVDFVKVEREDVPTATNVLIQDNLISRISAPVTEVKGLDVIATRTDKNIVVGLSDGSVQTFKVKDLEEGYPAVVGEPVNNVDGKLHKVLFAVEAEPNKEIYFYYSNGNISFLDLTEYTRTTNIARTRRNRLPVAHLPYLVECGYWTDEISRRVSVQISDWWVCWASWGEVKHKASNAVSRLIVPKEGLKRFYASKHEVADEWYMNEKYKRPRPIRIANDIVGWNLSEYFKKLAYTSNTPQEKLVELGVLNENELSS